MNNYLLFEYDRFYPGGGAADLIGGFETIDRLHDFLSEHLKENKYRADYYEVLSVDNLTSYYIDDETLKMLKATT